MATKKRGGKRPPTPKKPFGQAAAAVKAAPAPPVRVDEDVETAEQHDLMGLSIRQARFVDLYLSHYNASKAYIEAGFSAKPGPSAEACASKLLSLAKVSRYLNARIKALWSRTEDQQDALMRALVLQVSADPRELVEHYRGSCRYCWGRMNRYQYTAGEWDAIMTKHSERQEAAAEEGKPMPKEPDPKGGPGYLWGNEPNPNCPECSGLGLGKTIVKDTRNLSPAAQSIYAGVKEGKDGIEVKFKDSGAALATLVKIAKLYEDTTSVNVTINPADLEATFAARMAESRARMAQLRKERGFDSSPSPDGEAS